MSALFETIKRKKSDQQNLMKFCKISQSFKPSFGVLVFHQTLCIGIRSIENLLLLAALRQFIKFLWKVKYPIARGTQDHTRSLECVL